MKAVTKKNFVILLSSLAGTAGAQTNCCDIGIEGSIGVASLRGNEFLESHGLRLGYSGGIIFQYNFKNTLALKSGVYYERKGSSYDFGATDPSGNVVGTITGRENFDYVEIPMLLRATFGKKLNGFANAGPFVGFLLKQTNSTDSYNIFPASNSDNTENFKKVEAGLSFGIGLLYHMEEKYSLSIEVRDNLGLTNTSALPVYDDGTITTNSIGLFFGINYKLGLAPKTATSP
jgi:hypothetical protein